MREAISRQFLHQAGVERRRTKRETTVLRIGVISWQLRTTYCVLRNVSQSGLQVKLYDAVPPGEHVLIRVGDCDPLLGEVIWVRDRNAGIQLESPLSAASLLRIREHLDARRRRSIPRVCIDARAIVRSCGRTIRVRVHNISSVGAKVSAVRCLPGGAQLKISLPDLPELQAYVCWSEGGTFGIRFDKPISLGALAEWLALDNRVLGAATNRTAAVAPPVVGTPAALLPNTKRV